MKRPVISFLISILVAAVFSACTAPRNFSDLSNTRGVSMVYTSSALLKLTGGIASKLSGIDLKGVMDHVGSVRIIIADDHKAATKCASVVNYQIRQLHAIPLFEATGQMAPNRNNGSGIYVTSLSPDTFDNVVVVLDSSQKYQAIFLEGRLTVDDIKKLGL